MASNEYADFQQAVEQALADRLRVTNDLDKLAFAADLYEHFGKRMDEQKRIVLTLLDDARTTDEVLGTHDARLADLGAQVERLTAQCAAYAELLAKLLPVEQES